MKDITLKIKEVLDRECFENWHAKRCENRSHNLTFINTPCWVCQRNLSLAKELNDITAEVRSLSQLG